MQSRVCPRVFVMFVMLVTECVWR